MSYVVMCEHKETSRDKRNVTFHQGPVTKEGKVVEFGTLAAADAAAHRFGYMMGARARYWAIPESSMPLDKESQL